MNHQDLKLYELLADKTLSFGCSVREPWKTPWYEEDCRYVQKLDDGGFELASEEGFIYHGDVTYLLIIGHEPTLTDLQRWMKERNENINSFCHLNDCIIINFLYLGGLDRLEMKYDCSLTLMQQSESTKQEIIDLIESHMNKQVTILP